MPNLNIEIDAELLREIRIKAAQSDLTRREWVLQELTKSTSEPAPEPVSCERAHRELS
jgi:hypothetical protein